MSMDIDLGYDPDNAAELGYEEGMDYSGNPYRMPVKITREPEKKHGLIRVPATSPHECKTPSALLGLWYWITFRPIRIGSLFRCIKCDQVYEYRFVGESSYRWLRASNDIWIEKGGTL